MTEEQILEQWRHVVETVSPEIATPAHWTDEPYGTFLHAFRPDGAHLPELFTGMPQMAPVLERLGTVFELAGPETGHLYFFVSKPRRISDSRIRENVRTWLGTIARTAEELELELDAADRAVFDPDVEIQIVTDPLPRDASHSVRQTISECVTALFEGMTFDTAGYLLREPLYMLACSYELAYWILSPLDPASGDPFAPWGKLWCAGITLGFVGEGSAARVVAHRWTPATPPTKAD